MTTARQQIPLFPLHTVLFPGGTLPLRIFEPRYLSMVSDCMKRNAEFGVVLISKGQETGPCAETYSIGTLARITDFQQGDDGLLTITAEGGERFRIASVREGSQQQLHAAVDMLAPCPDEPVPHHYHPMAQALQELIEGLGDAYDPKELRYDSAPWVGYRLAELLPLKLTHKQTLLELADPVERLNGLAAGLRELQRRNEATVQ